MGLLESEITELKSLAKEVLSGQIRPEQAAVQLSIYNQIAKREQMILNSIGLAAKHGIKVWSKITKKNLLSDSSAIPIDHDEQQLIVCPEKGDTLINIEDCLTYSGTERNIDKCQECDHFSTTRKITFNK